MPTTETAGRKQKAVYQAASGFDGYGNPKVETAIEVSVRWENRSGEITDPNGNVVATSATVVVDRSMPVGSVLWLGTLKAFNALAATPTLLRVVVCDETPDIKGRNFRRVVQLQRLSAETPTAAT